jgi:hypothetical protein
VGLYNLKMIDKILEKVDKYIILIIVVLCLFIANVA